MIDYFKLIGRYNNNFNYKLGVDVILQDDGNGTYIKEWNLSESQPTMEQLTTFHNANIPTTSVCICNCSDSSTFGKPCECNGKVYALGYDLTLNSRVLTTVTYSAKPHDCYSEFNASTGIYKIVKTRKMSFNFIATLDDMPLDSTFEIWLYKNNVKIASNRTTPSIIDDITLSVSTAIKAVVGDEFKICLYNGSLISKLVVDYNLMITTLEE